MKSRCKEEFVYSPFCCTDYDLHSELRSGETEALSTSHKRSRNYSKTGPLGSLIAPLMDIAYKSGT